jgi:hypothetical protein
LHTLHRAIPTPRKLAKTNVQTTLCDQREPANASSLYLAVLHPRQIRHLDRVCLISGTLLRAAERLRFLRIPIADRCIFLLLSTITRLLKTVRLTGNADDNRTALLGAAHRIIYGVEGVGFTSAFHPIAEV